MQSKCDGTFGNHLIANFSQSVSRKECLNRTIFHHHHHHQFYFRHLAHIHIKTHITYSKTHTRNTQIMQIQVKLNKNSTISSCNCKHQKQLRAARWLTILLCKLQMFQRFEKIMWLLCIKVLKLGMSVSTNTPVRLSISLSIWWRLIEKLSGTLLRPTVNTVH